MAGPRLRAVAVVGVTAFALLATMTTATVAAPGSAPAGQTTHDEQITWQDWTGTADWSRGTAAGTVATPAGLTLGVPAGSTTYRDPHTGIKRTWAYGTWTSPVTPIGFDASEMIASWNATTPAGTWIQVELQGRYTSGSSTPWYVMSRWASGDADIRRASVDKQGDKHSDVWTDTLSVRDAAAGPLLRAYQLRLTLYRAPTSRPPRSSGWSAR
ncbi:hypothetical protein [Micromonospora inyonensis]|uniref:hypothetical protein n=1 Tax=Micromonospora inyonensis TaxID=47866 RepID=UPI001FDFDCA4|nr:hypothetical protein [Micromonospora inyonensis]